MSDVQSPARKPGPNTVAGVQPRSPGGQWQAGDDRRKLTEQQAAFVLAYAANGGNATDAAKTAGYSTDHSRTIGPRLLALPWVQRALTIERQRLLARAAFGGLKVLIGVLEDTGEDMKLRVKAAEIALKADRADRDAAKDSDSTGKRLAEMSIAELEGMIRRLDQAAELAQQPILEHNEPSPADEISQAIDPAG